ncbi:LacI family DNA-binding transcriptional regulator [Aquipuribacter sp. MA13-6]|uniref:LacI family DNA-binding transcriptional regulator n=1 Tax=unclassified Aquipuribacter TaxID=2635084 RepID=UPI003EE9353E
MRNAGRGTSLKDVAARAGVSVKTVSNVVNDYTHVSGPTRERVQQALAELNYRPNISARNLRAGRTGVIALALPELDLPYFAELARCVIKAAENHGWTVLIDQTDGIAEREELALDGIRGHLLDGLIFSPLTVGADELARRKDLTPLVLLGERVYDGPADHVAIDNVAAARDATTHLLQLGRRRVAAVGQQSQPMFHTAHLRLRGYTEALAAAGIALEEDLVVRVEQYHRGDGAAAMAHLLDLPEPPDAVFCFNDLLALGALRTLHERGIKVPEQVAVVGWDDIEDGRFSSPTLTTVQPDKEQVAATAVEMLAARLGEGRDAPPHEVVARHRLVVRESTRR